MGDETDGQEDALLALACLVHLDNNVRGKPLSPTVPSVKHTGSVAVPQRVAQAHSAVQEGGGSEAAAFGGRVGKGNYLKVIQRLWAHP